MKEIARTQITRNKFKNLISRKSNNNFRGKTMVES